MHRRCSSRRQLADCFVRRAVEVLQWPPVQPPVESGTDVSASQPKFDIIHLIDHLVLCAFQSAINQQETRRLTLIIARITLTEPKTALAGVMLESSFAIFKASMVTFNAEILPSRPLGRWDSASMAEVRGGYERT